MAAKTPLERPVNAHGELMPTRPLTPAQIEALRQRALGRTVDESAVAIGVSKSSLHERLRLAYRRLGAETLVDALLAIGWLRVPPITEDVGLARTLGRRTLPWWDVP